MSRSEDNRAKSGDALTRHRTASSSAPPPPPELAALGRFRLLALLGRGGMGEVYLALSRGSADSSKLVVIKRLNPLNAMEPSIREMFLDEGRLAVRLNHPNVVQTYEVIAEAGMHLLVMEYLEGQALARLVTLLRDSRRNVPREIALNVVIQTLSGLQHAHALTDYDGTRLNVVHRDLSPHNIFITYDGVVKLLDFGIAKAAVNSSTTQSGIFKGKPAYMAPEQVMGDVDARADLYTMGAVLWELLTGQRLFKKYAEPVRALLELVHGPPVPRPSTVVPDIPPRLDEIVAKALEKERDRRFSSAGAMREALVAYVNESGERAGPDEVGRLMGELFAKKRERVNKVIQEYVRNPPTPTAIPEALVSGKYALRGTGSVSVERSIASDQGSKLSALVRRTLPRRRGVLVTTLVVPVAVVLGVVAWRSWETRKSALSPAPSAAAVAPPPPASSSSMGPSATSPATGEQGVGAATSGASTEPAVSSPGAPSPAVRAWWGGRRIPSHESSQAPARASASEPAQEATPTVASAPAPPAVASTPPPPAVSSTAAPRGRVYRTDL